MELSVILVYVKTYALQVVQGRLFHMRQSKANQWIHVLLPALLAVCFAKELRQSTNAHIASGDNEYFEIKRRGSQSRWTLKYPRNTEPVNAPFFDALTQVDIGSVLHFVAQHCPFMEAFEHVLGRYTQQEIDPHILTACVLEFIPLYGMMRL